MSLRLDRRMQVYFQKGFFLCAVGVILLFLFGVICRHHRNASLWKKRDGQANKLGAGHSAFRNNATATELFREQTQRKAIVGGSAADPGEFPWYVSSADTYWYCGGSLVYEDVVLSAAHCHDSFEVGDPVYVGSVVRGMPDHGAVLRYVLHVVPHPHYNETTIENDFMLFKLNEPVRNIQPIVLNANMNVPTAGESVTIMGHGYTQVDNTSSLPQQLHKVDMTVVSHQSCEQAYSTVLGAKIVEDIMICSGNPGVGGKSDCGGDGGGPLVTPAGVQVGISSFAVGCGEVDYPSVFARVSGAYDWIQSTICLLSSNPLPDCPMDEVNPTIVSGNQTVKVVIQYDNYPGETSWTISQRGRILYTGPVDYTPMAGEKWETEFNEFPVGDFGFTIRDSFGDGMGLGQVLGFFQIWQTLSDGSDVLLAAGDHNFEFTTFVSFTVSADPPPTFAPSVAPIIAPTFAPTAVPSFQTTLTTCKCDPNAIDCIPTNCELITGEECTERQECAFIGENRSEVLSPRSTSKSSRSLPLDAFELTVIVIGAVLIVAILILFIAKRSAKSPAKNPAKNPDEERMDDVVPQIPAHPRDAPSDIEYKDQIMTMTELYQRRPAAVVALDPDGFTIGELNQLHGRQQRPGRATAANSPETVDVPSDINSNNSVSIGELQNRAHHLSRIFRRELQPETENHDQVRNSTNLPRLHHDQTISDDPEKPPLVHATPVQLGDAAVAHPVEAGK